MPCALRTHCGAESAMWALQAPTSTSIGATEIVRCEESGSAQSVAAVSGPTEGRRYGVAEGRSARAATQDLLGWGLDKQTPLQQHEFYTLEWNLEGAQGV